MATHFARNDIVGLGVVLLLAIAVRVPVALNAPVFFEGDARGYFVRAIEIVTGDGLNFTLKRTPGYSLVLAAVFSLVGPNLEAVALVQHACGVLTAALCFVSGRLIGGARVGSLAGVLAAISGSQIVYERVMLTETLFGMLLMLAVCVILLAHSRSSARWMFGAGVVLGIAALVRPVGLAAVGAAIPLMLLLFPLKLGARNALILALGVGALMAPWSLRNASAHGEASPVHPGRFLIERTVKHNPTGISMYAGRARSGESTELRIARQVVAGIESERPDSFEIYSALDRRLRLEDSQISNLMWELAVDAIKRHPDVYLRGTLMLLQQTFVGQHESVTEHITTRKQSWRGRDIVNLLQEGVITDLIPATLDDEAGRGQRSDLFTALFQPTHVMGLILTLNLLLLLQSFRSTEQRPALVPLTLAFSVIACTVMVVGYLPRYRYPLDPLLTIGAAAGAICVWDALIRIIRQRREDAIPQAVSGAD